MKYKLGRPHTLDEEIIQRILDVLPDSYTQSQVARLACLPQSTLNDWLLRGKAEHESGEDTIYAQLSVRYEQEKGHMVKGLINKMIAKGAWQAVHELLKVSAPDDFGKDPEMYKQLLDDYKKLIQDIQK